MLVQLFGKVEQVHRDLHAADSIGEGMVELADHRGATVFQAVDQRRLPQRPGSVEVLHLGQPGHFQYVVKRAGPGGNALPDVVVEVEVGGILPAGRGRPRRRHHPLPEHGEFAADQVESFAHLVPVRASIQQYDADHGRPQPRIAFHRPGEGVGVA